MNNKRKNRKSEIWKQRPRPYFTKWEERCLRKAQQKEEKPEWKAEQSKQKLWPHLKRLATAVGKLYEQGLCRQQGLCLWIPFQDAANSLTSLYKESMDAHQQCFGLGSEIGHQRLNKELLAWVNQCQPTIMKEDLIRVLLEKVPSPRSSHDPPHMADESSVAASLHSLLNGRMASMSTHSTIPASSSRLRKRTLAQCCDLFTDSPPCKRKRLI
ncbi:HUWE1-associated protein modifying stress responses-like [Pelobates fuscus]|uniref:HUWE1-associated protein modifying stress responses-like n=1 Tax=Pelobates fuscus TaxID=191477 RepID=UPI002FE4B3AC